MKLNPFLTAIALTVCGLLFWGLRSQWPDAALLPAVGTSVVAFILLTTALAVSIPDAKRSGVLVRIVSALFFAGMLATDIIFTSCGVSAPAFVITNGIMLCLWALLVYGLVRANQ